MNLTEIISKVISEEALSPLIMGVYIHTFEPGYKMEAPHEHADAVEVISVLYGSSFMELDGRPVRIKKNECLVIFPGVRHFYFLEPGQSCRLIDVHFSPGELQAFFNLEEMQASMQFFYELKTHTRRYIKLVDSSPIRDVSARICSELEHTSIYTEALLRLYFCELYIRLSKVMNDSYQVMTKPSDRHLNIALEYIRNFYNDKLTIDQVARQAGVSARHLARIFTDSIGMTVQDYINMLRIEKARELLENTDMDITQVALTAGFATSQYFSTCFKKYEGMTPKDFRRMILQRRDRH